MMRLLDGGVLYLLENQVKVKLGGSRIYHLLLSLEERIHFNARRFQPKNLQSDTENPMKYSFVMV